MTTEVTDIEGFILNGYLVLFQLSRLIHDRDKTNHVRAPYASQKKAWIRKRGVKKWMNARSEKFRIWLSDFTRACFVCRWAGEREREKEKVCKICEWWAKSNVKEQMLSSWTLNQVQVIEYKEII